MLPTEHKQCQRQAMSQATSYVYKNTNKYNRIQLRQNGELYLDSSITFPFIRNRFKNT